jgi:protein MpaA
MVTDPITVMKKRHPFTGPTRLAVSVKRHDILMYVRPGARDRTTLLLGGMHGDEPKSVSLLRTLIEVLSSCEIAAAPKRLVVIPVVNPDGFMLRKRRNARGVDINRNFPTANWQHGAPRSRMYGGDSPGSEPETRAVMKAVERFQPARIVTVHSISGSRQCNNYDGPGRALALKLSGINGYPATASIGYPTPGSFGVWAGRERRIPTITLELPSHHSAKRCWEENRDALLGLV